MSCPIFTIVNEDGTERVELVDANGVGNAIPTVQNTRDLDIRHDYVTGDMGKTPIRLAHEFTLSMDYVTQQVREKLLSMMYARDRVTMADPTIAPENASFGWRPAPITDASLGSETAYDLTGKTAIKSYGNSDKFAFWNSDTGEMEGPHADRQAPLLKTVHGEAYQAGRHTTNRSSNPYPESATQGHAAGEAGWYLGDASGIATLAHVSGGFSNTLCPDTLRVYSDGDAGDLSLTQSAYFTPAHADYGGWVPGVNTTCWASVWIKGTLPSTATVEHGPDGSKATEDISGMDLSQWTRLDFGEQNSSYSEYNFAINLTCAAGEIADFQVGPTMVCIEDTAESHGGPGPFTDETNSTTAAGYEVIRMFAPSYTSPAAGAATIWLSVPTGSNIFRTDQYREVRCGLFKLPRQGGGSWDGNCFLVQKSAANPETFQIRFVSMALSTYWDITTTDPLGPGIHSVTITWGSSGLNCYYDGQLLTAESGGVSAFNPGTTSLSFAGGIDGPYAGGSFLFHGFSILESELDAAGVAAAAASLTDPISRNLVDMTMGRLYEIVSIPSIPLVQEGPSAWMGDIRLRQVSYDGNNPAWFAEDIS